MQWACTVYIWYVWGCTYLYVSLCAVLVWVSECCACFVHASLCVFVSTKQWLSLLPEALIEASIKAVNKFVKWDEISGCVSDVTRQPGLLQNKVKQFSFPVFFHFWRHFSAVSAELTVPLTVLLSHFLSTLIHSCHFALSFSSVSLLLSLLSEAYVPINVNHLPSLFMLWHFNEWLGKVLRNEWPLFHSGRPQTLETLESLLFDKIMDLVDNWLKRQWIVKVQTGYNSW